MKASLYSLATPPSAVLRSFNSSAFSSGFALISALACGAVVTPSRIE
jgi:hypothetical protein